MKKRDPWGGAYRQVHLDFHNSPYLTDLASRWDPRDLARQFKEARVNRVVVFTKCVHGMAYYPSKVVTRHPALRGRDLTGDLVEALHREGIQAPLYTIVGWEEHLAQTHPEWMQMTEDGRFAQNATASDGSSPQPGRYRWLNFLHPDYQAYFAAHLEEVLTRYPVDGLFLDMLVVHPEGDWSPHALAFRRRAGLTGSDPLTHARFETAAQVAFCRKFTALIRSMAPRASLFYNSENRLYTRDDLGVPARGRWQTHAEIESLPSGMWNYRHFPRVARNLRHRGPWLGMTGRFQKMWGDFGGVKPAPALEYECFRTQAMGGANSVGDQMHPRGGLDRGAMELIGGVYRQVEWAEPFYRGAVPCPRVAVLCPHDPMRPEFETTLVEEGMLALCMEHHVDAAVVNEGDDLSGFELLVLGEGTDLTDGFRRKMERFVAQGGRVLAAGDTAFAGDGKAGAPFHCLRCHGKTEFHPSYWVARPGTPLAGSLGTEPRVFYGRGLRVTGGRGARIWARRGTPYFQRTDLTFSSHFQAPPKGVAQGEGTVWATRGGILFSDPVFSEYRRSGNPAVRAAFGTAVDALVGTPKTGYGLKSTVEIHPLRRGRDLLLTLLHYVPERRALEADVISERLGFGGQVLRFPGKVPEVRVFGAEDPLPEVAGAFPLPNAEGRMLLTVPDFFGRA